MDSLTSSRWRSNRPCPRRSRAGERPGPLVSGGPTRALERCPWPTGTEGASDFAEALPNLPIDEQTWEASYELARQARARGVTVPATDVVIAACAIRHGAAIESADSDFALLASVTG